MKSAECKNLTVVSINEDTIRDAKAAGRDLYKEFAAGRYHLGIFLPEQLQTPSFADLIKNQVFLALLRYLDVDEIHLMDSWGQTFLEKPYQAISNLRYRLTTTVVFTGLTATLIPGGSEKRVLDGLSFVRVKPTKSRTKDGYILYQLPIDRPRLKYTARFLKHSISGMTFPDFYWIISLLLRQSEFSQRIVISCGTIDLATRLMEWIESFLPSHLPHRDLVVMPYHSLLGDAARTKTISNFENEYATSIINGTNCMGNGLDIKTDLVVLIKMEDTLEGMVQRMGRAGRRGYGETIAYAPPWVELEKATDSVPKQKGGKGMSRKTLDDRRAKRARLADSFIPFFNPTTTMCSRAALSNAFKEPYTRPTYRLPMLRLLQSGLTSPRRECPLCHFPRQAVEFEGRRIS